MNVDTSTLISITEANQNFSRVARLVDEKGSAVILKNNKPRYLIINFDTVNENETASDEDVLSISGKLMKKNRKAYEELDSQKS
ncbi:type II toxin-antitoxin system Phd/YefM family antitoxin [Dialister sp.]|uniref:type II toxin-antitoxin system Phd/YefM family antitoxin n=1 Tax=Dialister sp. TaxID=1955814 RepID=UPI002E823734|nr:type II toxin-antitoxin system Phd/YefM family antitoxin [Dialister sp.]MEE3453074.1 type II toxin-antitoxin system Phd/YefM family antitoxin [Dialister sp.]